jgi:ribosomal protein RSM22 (predicted rRNA methylase)
MDLPPALRLALDRVLSGNAPRALAETAAALSERYRDEHRAGPVAIVTRDHALAYLATRLPATYAAIRASIAAVAQAHPGFAPNSMLDVGAGPGTALWATADCWPELEAATLIDASHSFVALGQALASAGSLPRATWRRADIVGDDLGGAAADFVTAGYVLNELPAAEQPRLVDTLWRLTTGVLLIVEPGTPAGWQRILAARGRLIDAGGHVVAPCPHARPCPLTPPDWCHFVQRVARSRAHRQTKGAELAWEDEKFSYVAVSRPPPPAAGARVIARPRKGSGRVTLKLFRPDGTAGEVLISRRDRDLFKQARRADWGDSL